MATLCSLLQSQVNDIKNTALLIALQLLKEQIAPKMRAIFFLLPRLMWTKIELVHPHRHTPPPKKKSPETSPGIIYFVSIWYAAWLNCEKLLFRRKKHFQR